MNQRWSGGKERLACKDRALALHAITWLEGMVEESVRAVERGLRANEGGLRAGGIPCSHTRK